MNKKILYRIAYRALNNATPLKIDCGTLCSSSCCKGDQDTGMYLFPGEEIMFKGSSDFLTIKEIELVTGMFETYPVKLAVCSGKCDRDLRPLSCRIFPLTPYIDAKDTLSIKLDPRAMPMCPLVQYSDERKLNSVFVKKVRDVFRLLSQDKEIMFYIRNLSGILDQYGKL